MTYAPLTALIAYIVFSFSLILFGPIIYLGFNPLITAAFLGAVLLCMIFGYRLGVGFNLRKEEDLKRDVLRPASIGWLFYSCLAISLAGLLFASATAIVAGTVNLSVASLGETYIDYYAGYERNTGSYSLDFIVLTLTTPPTFVATVWGLMYFERLSFAAKSALVLLIAGTLLFYTIGTGKQKQLGDTVIYVLLVLAVRYARSGKAVNVKVLLASVSGLIVGLLGFITILGQRYAALGIGAGNIGAKVHPLQVFDLDHALFRFFGFDFGFSVAMFSSYLSQGYFGLSLSLDREFVWTHFVGFSYAVSTFANQFLGLEWFYLESYPYRAGLETGWGESKWHSAFPYWASDFTFPGTATLFGVFAYVWAKSWLGAIRREDPYAVLMFVLMGLGAVFLPANNQWFISPGGVMTVALTTVLYVATRNRRFPALSRATRVD